MAEILPDGSFQGYSSICSKCKKTIKVNFQGNELESHQCIELSFQKKMSYIHQGMKNVPDLKKELCELRDKITSVIDNEERHLAAVGILVNIYGNDLISLSKKIFEAHKIDKSKQ